MIPFIEFLSSTQSFPLVFSFLGRRAPVQVLQIPSDRLLQALLEGMAGFPTQFPSYFTRVDRVAAVVPRTVPNEGLQTAVIGDSPGGQCGVLRGGKHFIQQGAKAVHYLQIGSFAPAA